MSRLQEILFGLIMAVGVTGSLNAATEGRAKVMTVLWSALGCNLAWGIVDAVMFIMTALAQREHQLKELRDVRQASPEEGRRLLAAAAASVGVSASTLDDGAIELERMRLVAQPEPTHQVHITLDNLAGALMIFILVVLATVPVVVPFLVVRETTLALRISQAIAGLMLFLAGYAWGRAASHKPWKTGIAMAAIGFAMVAITVALGG